MESAGRRLYRCGGAPLNIQAEISLYPLRTPNLAELIDRFIQNLRRRDLKVKIGTMSSRISGECKILLSALGEAFEDVAREGEMVLTVKISNACPLSLKEGKNSSDNSSRVNRRNKKA